MLLVFKMFPLEKAEKKSTEHLSLLFLTTSLESTNYIKIESLDNK